MYSVLKLLTNNFLYCFFFSQEGVSEGIYQPLEVQVEGTEGKQLDVRTYQLVAKHNHGKKTPSPHYLQVILSGK